MGRQDVARSVGKQHSTDQTQDFAVARAGPPICRPIQILRTCFFSGLASAGAFSLGSTVSKPDAEGL